MASDPITAGAGAYAGGKAAIAMGFGGVAALMLVILWKLPATPREWALTLASTFLCSIFGGAAVALKFGLHLDQHGFFGLVALAGVFAACGVPGWTIVRAVFVWLEKRKNLDIEELARSVRGR